MLCGLLTMSGLAETVGTALDSRCLWCRICKRLKRNNFRRFARGSCLNLRFFEVLVCSCMISIIALARKRLGSRRMLCEAALLRKCRGSD